MGYRKTIIIVTVLAAGLAGCSADDAAVDGSTNPLPPPAHGDDAVAGEAEQPPITPQAPNEPRRTADPPGPIVAPTGPTISGFFDPADDALSTFAMDVDSASYTYARSWIDAGRLPDPATVRPEEFVNHFDYDYPAPAGDAAWGVHVDGGPTPWNAATHLVRVGLNTVAVHPDQRPDATLTFVIDVSGSMTGAPIETVKDTLTLLASRLRPSDRIGIVTYGSTGSVLLDPTPLAEGDRIADAIRRLETGGSTYAEEGLRIGYEQARAAFVPGGINTVVLASDGVANVGATGPEAILATIRENVDAGIDLLALGVGGGDGYNDHLMETLTNTGNGTSFYVSGREEAERLFVDRLESTLVTVARDSKVQVAFDPATVARWRLIGYDNRDIADDDFRDDTVDAGEVGAGHEVTAVYEVELYPDAVGEIGTVALRWADPKDGAVTEVDAGISTKHVAADPGHGYATAVQAVALAEVLRGSPHVGDWQLADVAELAGSVDDLAALADRAARIQPEG